MTKKTIKGLTPNQIVQKLNQHIIGQNEAKKSIAICYRNRLRRMQADTNIRESIMPMNMLMIGPTGCGKTEIARRLAKIAGLAFSKEEATNYTETGYVGKDINQMIENLAAVSYAIAVKKFMKLIEKKVEKIVNNKILDQVIPPNPEQKTTVIDTEAVPQEDDINAQTRARFLKKIENGELDHREIEIEVEKDPTTGIGFMGHGMMDQSSMMNLQNMMKRLIPKNIERKTLTIGEARSREGYFFRQTAKKLMDEDEVNKLTVKIAENGIICLDEMDKIASPKNKGNNLDVNRSGVQRNLLPLVEGCKVSTKYGIVNTEKILFIALGAFHESKPSDLMPELQGRFPIHVKLNKLTEQDLIDILIKPKNSLIKQQQAMLEVEGVKLTFEPGAVEEIGRQAYMANQNREDIGARRLSTAVRCVMDKVCFETPDTIQPGEEFCITKQYVIDTLAQLVQEKDVSHYIL